VKKIVQVIKSITAERVNDFDTPGFEV
jgi:hypothetical protein